MNILLVYRHWAVSSGRYMTDAFKRLGHDVRHVGPAHGRDIWGITVSAKYVHEPDTILVNWRPELVIAMDSDPIMLNLAGTYAEEAPVIVAGVDNHVRDYRRPWFDHYFLAHRSVSVVSWDVKWVMNPGSMPMGYTPDDMTWLPCAYDPTIFTPSPIPYAEREYDVCMIGVMYPQRWQLVSALKAAGLKVYAGTGLLYEGYRDAYHNARISLCVSANGDVAQRVFETAAMGCLVVSDECADYKLLKPKGIWTCPPGQFVDYIKMLINDPEYAQPLIAQSLEWVRPHTWDARAQTIIDWYEKRQAGEAAHENV